MITTPKPYKTRFAPSPTGLLHLGHGFAALKVLDHAIKNNGTILLRIEDIDQTRCKPEYTEAIFEDLKWLGIPWETSSPPRYQSQHFDDYGAALSKLNDLGLIYPCTCSRSDIKNITNLKTGPEGIVYPGTCRDKDLKTQGIDKSIPFSLRLNLGKSIAYLKAQNRWPLYWHDEIAGEQKTTPEIFGDVILARKDTPTSYHLAVTVDDHLQNITHVVRGMDLFMATHVHRLLQALLGLEVPTYCHHELIMADDGEKLSKRNKVKPLKAFREEGLSVDDVTTLIQTSKPLKN